MKVAVRADASIHIGTGHVMRSLTLAEVLRAQGADVRFICRKHPGHLCDTLASKGFAVSSLPEAPPSGDGSGAKLDWEVDAQQVATVLAEHGPFDWLIVDHYDLDHRWENALRQYAKRLLAIDDLANRRHDCDLLLDQNYYENASQRYQAWLPPETRQLLGPRFALLREDFSTAQETVLRDFASARRILVFFGGADRTNETLKALDALQMLVNPTLAVDVVIGPACPHSSAILERAGQLPHVTCYQSVSNMAALMAQADVFLGAGGSTTWERCCLGLPSLVVTIAENQEETTTALAEAGYIWHLGRSEEVTKEHMASALSSILHNPALLKYFSSRCRTLVDGHGAGRVARAMGSASISLRPATPADCKAVFHWRNAEENRRHVFSPAPIPWEVHQSWFMRSLEDPEREILIGEHEGDPIGVVRYDLSDSSATISVYLVPGIQGQGIGSQLIRAGSAWLKHHHPKIRNIHAEILSANLASKKAFQRAGYSERHAVYEEVIRP